MIPEASNLRVLILSQYFTPEPFFKGLPLAQALRERGHSVEVLTGFPNYPGGTLHPGYRIRPWQREIIDGVTVNRVPLYPSHDRNGLRRIMNFSSFGFSAATIGPWLVRKPDVIFVYNLVTLGAAAGMIRRLTGCKIILDVEDLWPESVLVSGMLKSKLLTKLLGIWCQREYRRPDRLIAISPGFKRHLTRIGVDESRIDVVYNWCDESQIVVPDRNAVDRAALGLDGRFNVVFAGSMGVMQSIETAINAAKNLFSTAPDIQFTFVGDGSNVARLKTLSAGMTNVRFIPRQPMKKIGEYFAAADALLVHLKDDPLFSITVPSKIQAYMHAGKPIICGVNGDAANLVMEAKAGMTFTPGNPESLTEAVLKLRSMPAPLRQQMGANGNSYYSQNLSFDRGVRKIEAIFQKALSQPNGVIENGCT